MSWQMSQRQFASILGDPGADSGDEEKSKRAEKYMARRKVKNGEKSLWGQCLTRPVPNGRRRSGFRLVPEKHKFSGTNQKPERRRSFGTGLVRHCPQGLFSPFFTFLRAIYVSARLDFSSSPLSAPGSPRMIRFVCSGEFLTWQMPQRQFASCALENF